MSDLSPTELYHRYQHKELDKVSVVGYLKSIIESSNEEHLRVRSVEILGEMGLELSEIFKFFEHLVTSDTSEDIRFSSVKVIIANYLEKGVGLLKWVFQHEQTIKILLEILKSLQLITAVKTEELTSIFERIIEERFAQIDEYTREEMGIGQVERFLRIIQPYLTEAIFYEDLDTLALDKLYDEIVELAELELISNNKTLEIMKLISDRYLAEGASEHDWHERWLLYQKVMLSSEFGLVFDPNDKKLLFNFGIACNYLDLYYPAINAFLCLYKIEKNLDKKKYRKLKRIKKQGGTIVEYGKSGSLDLSLIHI